MVTRGSAIDVVAGGFSFLEAPRWHDGRLYASEWGSRRVIAVSGADVTTVCTLDDVPGGIGFRPDGSLRVVAMNSRRVVSFDGTSIRTDADLGTRVRWPLNDLVQGHGGTAYVGNFGWEATDDALIATTAIHSIDAEGQFAEAASGLVFPNGMVITPDGQTLLVAETFAARVTAFRVAPDGRLGSRWTWAEFGDSTTWKDVREAKASGVLLPDGIALDAEGCLWVGDASSGAIVRADDAGRILERISFPGYHLLAGALGGADGRTLFICANHLGAPREAAGALLLRSRVAVPAAVVFSW
ncbi:MAG TPA: SMP-30/gluconolactonase/LRE family protein [Gaiellaceae bacterium]|jgi:sugar lactone lactonase YvrE|nr:SMP-30/gluconolactonase/LRE family protein [Gaiellaceae bacterium]